MILLILLLIIKFVMGSAAAFAAIGPGILAER